MSMDAPHTNAILGGYSPQYDAAAIAADLGGDQALASLFSRDKEAAFRLAITHLVPRNQRPHTAEELLVLEAESESAVRAGNLHRKRKYRITKDHLDIVSVAPEHSTIVHHLIVAENDPGNDGKTTLVGVRYPDSIESHGPEEAERMRQGEGWVVPTPPRDVLADCVAVRQRVVEAERHLAELVQDERTVFADAVTNHQVSMYAIQEATASAGVRISQQGVRKLIAAPHRDAQR